jgi:hypothetical protein
MTSYTVTVVDIEGLNSETLDASLELAQLVFDEATKLADTSFAQISATTGDDIEVVTRYHKEGP